MSIFWLAAVGAIVLGYPSAMAGAANAAQRLTGRQSSAESQRAKDLGALTFFVVSLCLFLPSVYLWPDKGLLPTLATLLISGLIGEFAACVLFGPVWNLKSRSKSDGNP
ncbi:MAG: hypothetical protein CMJ58_03805 [Planctomycetaceae bacterium]|nr:hypothetical protein [Planctomycetaceae bacterium]